MNNKNLIEHILSYMAESDRRYAIALEGDWGSGKTRFCEGELCAALANCDEQYLMLRVSLFGVTDVETLYARIAMTLAHVNVKDDDNRGARLVKSAGTLAIQGAASKLKKMFGDQGIDLNVQPQMLSAALGRKQLLVLDDFERNRFSEDQMLELYGAINSLVEGQNCKVMFVTNNFLKMNKDLREKLIWKCYRFEPDPKDLANSIIVPGLSQNARELGFEPNGCVLEAAAGIGCTNARAMIKASPLISMALSSNAACDSLVDCSNRRDALCDFVRYSLLAAMGSEPERPPERNPGEPYDPKRTYELVSYNHYSKLDVICDFFSSKSGITREDVDVCIAHYITSEYAGSPETMRVARLLAKTRDVQSLEDEEVACLASELSYCFLNTRFDLAHLLDVVQISWTLRSWGFEEALDRGAMIDRAHELIDEDPRGAYRAIHGRYLVWMEEWSTRYDGLMAEIDAYAVKAYETWRYGELTRDISFESPEAGKLVSDVIQNGWSRGDDIFLDFEPAGIAMCFERGDAESQCGIYHMAKGLGERAIIFTKLEAMDWVRSLLDAMQGVKPPSRMGRVRKRWTIDALDGLVGISVND